MLQEVHNDICARLPHGVIVHTALGDGHLCGINQTIFGNEYMVNIKPTKREKVSEVTPYLRPMDSMTEDEAREFFYTDYNTQAVILGVHFELTKIEYTYTYPGYDGTLKVTIYFGKYSKNQLDWLNGKMFDWRDLIGGDNVVLPAPNNMYK